MATQQELQTVAKTFFDKIVLLSASYFQFRLNHHTHYESYLKYSVFVVWFSFLIFVVRFQPADKLAAAETEANSDAEEAEGKEQKRGAGAFAGAEQAAEKAFGCLRCAMNGSKTVSTSAPPRSYPSGTVKNGSELRAA